MTLNAFSAISLMAVAFAACSTAASAAPVTTCYINDGFAVSASDDGTGDNTVFTIKRKADAAETMTCPLLEAEADLSVGTGEYGTRYVDLLDNHLVTMVSPAQVGDLVVVDLRKGETVLNINGTYDYTDGDTLYYWERAGDGTEQTCSNYAEVTQNGLAAGLLNQMTFDLTTGSSTATGETDCESLS